MLHFLEADIREQKKYKKRNVDNAVNHLHYEIKFENHVKKVYHLCYKIKFENHVKDKNNFFIKQNIAFIFKQKYILFLEAYFLTFLRT